MSVFFLLLFQLAGVKVFIFIEQMGLSIARVNVESCVVVVTLHHLLFGEFTCMFITGTVS